MDDEKDPAREDSQTPQERAANLSRRAFAVAGASFAASAAAAQTRSDLLAGREGENRMTNPGPKNEPLVAENPDSNLPPFTDRGDPGVTWFSFDLTPRRVQGGGWTHQVTERQFPSSRDVAGVNMRLTSGGIRELHWHTANEWAMMLTGTARVTVMQPDGQMFIDDVGPGDLWYFPAGLPHSIQGLGAQGTEFLLVFDEGNFSEDDTFLISETLAHTPPEIIRKNMGWPRSDFDKLPATQLYIFAAPLPGPLEADRRALGDRLETKNKYTYKLSEQRPDVEAPAGSVKIADIEKFPVSTGLCAAQVTLKPGSIRELHWHTQSSEWQYYLQGKGRMTVITTGARARTMDFNANDVGFVPLMATHYIENTGSEDLVFLEILKAPRFFDVSVNEWIARLPDSLAEAHLKLPLATIRSAPQGKRVVLPQ